MRAVCRLAPYPPRPPLGSSSSAGLPDCPPTHERETLNVRGPRPSLQYYQRVHERENYFTVTMETWCSVGSLVHCCRMRTPPRMAGRARRDFWELAKPVVGAFCRRGVGVRSISLCGLSSALC